MEGYVNEKNWNSFTHTYFTYRYIVRMRETRCEQDLESIDASEIKQIEHTGTTGGKDGNFSYSFSDKEVVEFIDLLNQVKLGDIVDENKALSSGAVSYYTIYFATDETLTISPGKYFEVEDTYYEFDNYDELWDEFIVFNSIK